MSYSSIEGITSKLRFVCRRWRRISESDMLLTNVCLDEWGITHLIVQQSFLNQILNTFKNFEQIAFLVPCRDGGSEILNPCGIMNRLSFCSVKLWAGGSGIPNLSNKESAIGARSLLHEIVQFDGIGKLDAMFLVDSSEHFFFSSR